MGANDHICILIYSLLAGNMQCQVFREFCYVLMRIQCNRIFSIFSLVEKFFCISVFSHQKKDTVCWYIVYFTSNKVLGYAEGKDKNCALQSYHLFHCGIDKR